MPGNSTSKMLAPGTSRKSEDDKDHDNVNKKRKRGGFNKELFKNIKIKKTDKDELADKLHKKFKCKVDKKKRNNIYWNPVAQQLRDGCLQEWEQYSDRLQYTPTGKIAYISPKEMKDVVGYFDPYDIPEDSLSIVVVGKRRTGKSHLVRNLCEIWGRDMRMFDEVYVFTKTSINEWYQEFIPQQYIYDGWDKEKADTIWKRAMWKTWLMKKHGVGKGARILVICDDLLSDSATHRNDPTLLAFYTAGRHVGITVIYITQKFKGTIPAIRDNTDIVFSFNMFNQNEARQLSEEFLGGLNIRTAMELIDLYANQKLHTCLVIETWRNNRDPAVYLKFYAAPKECDLKKGEIGSKEYIQLAAEMQAKIEMEEEAARSKPVGLPAKEGFEYDDEEVDVAGGLFRHLL